MRRAAKIGYVHHRVPADVPLYPERIFVSHGPLRPSSPIAGDAGRGRRTTASYVRVHVGIKNVFLELKCRPTLVQVAAGSVMESAQRRTNHRLGVAEYVPS